jgi:HEAT repeat protein
MGPWVSDNVIEALDDKNRLVRMGAAEALGELHDPRGVEPLIKLLQDPDRELAGHVSAQLTRIGTPSIKPLVALLTSENASIRSIAVSTLGHIRDHRVVEPVGRMLFDADQTARDCAGYALYLLAFTGDAGTTWRASDAIADKTAAETARHENDAILQKLVGEQCGAALRSDSAPARLATAKSMHLFAFLIPSTNILDGLASCLSDHDAELREHAAQTLAIIDHVDVYKPLLVGLRDEERKVRIAAAGGLRYRTSLDHYRSSREFDDGVGSSLFGGAAGVVEALGSDEVIDGVTHDASRFDL